MTTFVSLAALLISLVALGYAWKLNRELDSARSRLDRYNRALFKSEESIKSLRAELGETSTRMRLELLMRTGGAQFTPEMTVREAMLLHPLSQQVLAGFHLGGCSSCAVDPDDTLAAICRGHGVDETELLANLNGLLKGANGAGSQQPIKAP
ncbi:MAG: hypothetical protein R6W76_08250, partial [Caldilinea sp.]